MQGTSREVRMFFHRHQQIDTSWNCRICQQNLCREVSPFPNKCPGYDTKLLLSPVGCREVRLPNECPGYDTKLHLKPDGWDCSIYQLDLCRRVRPPCNECPGYDIKKSDVEASVMLELWGMQSTTSLSSLPGQPWRGVVLSERVKSMGQIELFEI